MKTEKINSYTAFEGGLLLFRGDLSHVVLSIKKHLGRSENSSILIFNDLTGKTMDFNFYGTQQDVLKRLEKYTLVAEDSSEPNTGPGRPKLGVVSREVSLLPRHWEWLATQSGGASATLRLLVDEARKKSSSLSTTKQLQERAYQVMSVLAGDLPGYEEALRALYKKDAKTFFTFLKGWPKDFQKYINELTKPILEEK